MLKKIAIILIFMCFKIPVEAQGDTTIDVYICRVVKGVEKKMPFWETQPNINEFINRFGAPVRIAMTTSEIFIERGYYFLNDRDGKNADTNKAIFIQILDDSLMPEAVAAHGGKRYAPTYFEIFELKGNTTFFIRLNKFAIHVGDDIRSVFNQFPNGYKQISDKYDDAIFSIDARTDITIDYNKKTFIITGIEGDAIDGY